jgi:glycosyltransferase involved in cell wall biosynthesis
LRIASFTVITPCRQAASAIGATAESILAQTAVRSGRLRLEYIVCDGGSTDGTLDEVRRVCGDRAKVVSERDGGMYEALVKGFRAATGDVVSYLNAGDLYSPGAFEAVADVMERFGVRWVTGMRVGCNERHQVVEVLMPYPYHRGLIRKGVYGHILPPIQQESTFWRRSLLDSVDLDRLASLRYAGDFYLWRSFAEESDLALVEAYLGGFTHHRGQLSENREAYLREVDELRSPYGLLDWLRAKLEQKLWYLPTPWKKRFHPDLVFRYDHAEGRWE